MSESPIDVDRSAGEEEDVKPKSEEQVPRKRVCHPSPSRLLLTIRQDQMMARLI